MNNQQLQIYPIGNIYDKEGSQYLKLQPEFIRGLKNLSLFSHALLLYHDIKQGNIIGTTLSQKTVRLEQVDEINGLLRFSPLRGTDTAADNIFPGTVVYDIKPYFPNEDRVRDAVNPPAANIKNDRMPSAGGLAASGLIHKERGRFYLEIPEQFDDYAAQLEGYSHLKILWWFHKFDKSKYRRNLDGEPPYENAPRTGVFACRAPVRPNPLAMTTARILSVDPLRKRIQVSQLDCLDNTPWLGLCPYLPQRDCCGEYRIPPYLEHWSAWMDDREFTGSKIPPLAPPPLQQLEPYALNQEAKAPSDNYFRPQDDTTTASEAGIVIRGASQNNLKHIDVTIPYGKITVITGVSGSGKSSLAFDTLYAESQQRFFANLSFGERAHLSLPEKPQVEQITGLPPAIAIAQQLVSRNPRSTVGTVTDLYHLLRALYANIGLRHCPECGAAVIKLKPDEITSRLSSLKPQTRLNIRPYLTDTKEAYALSIPPRQDQQFLQFQQALADAVRQSLKIGKGAIRVRLDEQDEFLLQTTETCYDCNYNFFELTASDFSFNNPESMCPVCNGLGNIIDIDAAKIVTQPDKSLLDGASPFWGDLRKFRRSPNANWMKGEILGLAAELHIDLELPWKELPESFRHQAINGSGTHEVTFTYENHNGRTGSITRPVEGAYNILKRLSQSAGSEKQQAMIAEYTGSHCCPCCEGERLKAESRVVTVSNVRFPELMKLSLKELDQWVIGLPGALSSADAALARPLLQELHEKLSDYIRIGLGYLTLDRPSPSLSGGEFQRLQLVSQLSSKIANILYILDEPTAGLHPRDYDKLMAIIQKLKKLGNTIVIVEHAPAIMLAADHIIDIGGGSGESGGYLIGAGTPQQLCHNEHSETGRYLSGRQKLLLNTNNNPQPKNAWVCLNGVTGNNLKQIDIKFPQQAVTCITGVSGSGKSSLVSLGILPAIQACIEQRPERSPHYQSITGADNFERIIHVSQKPIGRSSRSTPATYTGIMDELRLLFAKTPKAAELGYTQSKFSYNSKDGQCPACSGYGYQSLEATFMPGLKSRCHLCQGTKFHQSTLQIRYQDKNIAEILDMTIADALVFFSHEKKLQKILHLLNRIGLGYLKLGQSSQTLSGGEAQRIKLATELNTAATGNTLYLLDEPTTGLHFSDIQNLLTVLQKIAESGSTIILIEHNPDVIRNADWIIDLGPEGGTEGGHVVVQGSVADVIGCSDSCTGRFL